MSLYWILPSYEYYSISSDKVWVLYKAYNVKYQRGGSLLDPMSLYWILLSYEYYSISSDVV